MPTDVELKTRPSKKILSYIHIEYSISLLSQLHLYLFNYLIYNYTDYNYTDYNYTDYNYTDYNYTDYNYKDYL